MNLFLLTLTLFLLAHSLPTSLVPLLLTYLQSTVTIFQLLFYLRTNSPLTPTCRETLIAIHSSMTLITESCTCVQREWIMLESLCWFWFIVFHTSLVATCATTLIRASWKSSITRLLSCVMICSLHATGALLPLRARCLHFRQMRTWRVPAGCCWNLFLVTRTLKLTSQMWWKDC